MTTKKDIAFENFMRESNPIKKKGIKRNSQITGKPPTARLKKRRAKNTEPGYFPNPATFHSNYNFDVELKTSFEKLQGAVHNRKSNEVVQAYVSYCQGLIDAAIFFQYLTPAIAQKWKREISKLVPLRLA